MPYDKDSGTIVIHYDGLVPERTTRLIEMAIYTAPTIVVHTDEDSYQAFAGATNLKAMGRGKAEALNLALKKAAGPTLILDQGLALTTPMILRKAIELTRSVAMLIIPAPMEAPWALASYFYGLNLSHPQWSGGGPLNESYEVAFMEADLLARALHSAAPIRLSKLDVRAYRQLRGVSTDSYREAWARDHARFLEASDPETISSNREAIAAQADSGPVSKLKSPRSSRAAQPPKKKPDSPGSASGAKPRRANTTGDIEESNESKE